MKFTGWLAVIANVAAQVCAATVFFGSAKVIGTTIVMAEGDAYLLIALEAIAFIFTAALAIQLLVWKPRLAAKKPK